VVVGTGDGDAVHAGADDGPEDLATAGDLAVAVLGVRCRVTVLIVKRRAGPAWPNCVAHPFG